MIESTLCNAIIKEYYREIYNFCFANLNYNHQSAEDCTQETFLIFFSKHKKLYLSDNIRIWLYQTAERVIKAYKRKNNLNEISIDTLTEEPVSAENEFEQFEKSSILDELNEEEMKLLKIYYDHSYGERKTLAEKNGMTLSALYNRVHKIRLKLLDKTNKIKK